MYSDRAIPDFPDPIDIGGVRPVVYLKSDIKTSGKNSSGAWIITE